VYIDAKERKLSFGGRKVEKEGKSKKNINNGIKEDIQGEGNGGEIVTAGCDWMAELWWGKFKDTQE
jgi:hypothetical protein